jgi:hypothetical protein
MMRQRGQQFGITGRDLYKGGCSRNATTMKQLLAKWKAEGRIEEFMRKPDGAGRPTIAYRRHH